MRATDGQELSPLAFEQQAPRRKAVQCHPSEHEERPETGFVFQKDDQVVSEVEICLERTGRLECSAAQMLDPHLTRTANFVA